MDQPVGEKRLNAAKESTEPDRDLTVLILLLSVCAALALLFFGWRNAAGMTNDPNWYGLALTVFAALLLANTTAYPLLKSLAVLRRTFITVITMVLVFVALSGIEKGSGILWLYAFPPVVFYVSSLRFGATMCVATLLILGVVFTPAGHSITAMPDYTLAFKLGLINSLTFVMVFSFIDRKSVV